MFYDDCISSIVKGLSILIIMIFLWTVSAANQIDKGIYPDLSALDGSFCGNDYCKKLVEKYVKQHEGEVK